MARVETTPAEQFAVCLLSFFFGQLDAAIMWTRASEAERREMERICNELRPIIQQTCAELIVWGKSNHP
jgi:hypothetical protein